ncbi:MAG: DegV family protein [Candidatus Woesearchaeota archaeon]
MGNIEVIVDSGASFPEEWYEQNGLIVIPLRILFDGEKSDKLDFSKSPEEFYAELIEIKNEKRKPPITSGANDFQFTGMYDYVFSKGAKSALVLTLMKEKSSTYKSANLAQSYNARSKDIRIIDTHMVGPSQAFIALEASIFSKEHSLDETVKYAEQLSQQAKMYAVPETLYFLHAGGRISSTRYLIGSILKLLPIVSTKKISEKDYDLDSVVKARTFDKAISKIPEKVEIDIKEFKSLGLDTVDYMVLHTGNQKKAVELETNIKELFKLYGMQEGIVARGYLPIVVGAHLGPGAVGVGMLYRNGFSK